ncbi:MAG: hypothetical protein RI101_11170 [Nitrospira sp.]|jgi:hypothetical protein|nr:hypothetical protein [Nitrospira sp.]
MALVRVMTAVLSCSAFLFAGCSQQPLSRISHYVGGSGEQAPLAVSVQPASVSSPIMAGLLVINDTSAAGPATALSDRAKAFLTHQVRERVEGATPIHIAQVLAANGSAQPQGPDALVKLAREQGLTHLLVALFSSAESEVPMYLPLTGDPEQGGSRPGVPGYEAVNYALAELALLDTASGQVIARSDGRAWARLNRLNVPMASNAYPVIHRSLRPAPIYPPAADAKDVLRSLAADEALEQAASKLQEAWPKS